MNKKNIIPRAKPFMPIYGLLNQVHEDLTTGAKLNPSKLGVGLGGLVLELGRDIPTLYFTQRFDLATGLAYYLTSTYILDRMLEPFKE